MGAAVMELVLKPKAVDNLAVKGLRAKRRKAEEFPNYLVSLKIFKFCLKLIVYLLVSQPSDCKSSEIRSPGCFRERKATVLV